MDMYVVLKRNEMTTSEPTVQCKDVTSTTVDCTSEPQPLTVQFLYTFTKFPSIPMSSLSQFLPNFQVLYKTWSYFAFPSPVDMSMLLCCKCVISGSFTMKGCLCLTDLQKFSVYPMTPSLWLLFTLYGIFFFNLELLQIYRKVAQIVQFPYIFYQVSLVLPSSVTMVCVKPNKYTALSF